MEQIPLMREEVEEGSPFIIMNRHSEGALIHSEERGTDTMDLQPDRTERLFLLIRKIISSIPGAHSGSRKMTDHSTILV